MFEMVWQARAKVVKAAGGARGGSQIPLEADPPAFLSHAEFLSMLSELNQARRNL
jgi:hypothetical protein